MIKSLKTMASGLAMAALVTSTGITFAGDHANYCMDVVIEPFHMMPDPTMPDPNKPYPIEAKTCMVPQYWDGKLQDAFYPFTKEDHLFNCEYFGPLSPLPIGDVPSAVASQGFIDGTVGGHAFKAKLSCASLTNWYQDSCSDPENPDTCTFQLAQPFLKMKLPFPRVTEVSIFDGVITVKSGRHARKVPIVLATRAAGITHVEDLSAPLVGASVTHSLLGMVTYEASDYDDRDYKKLDGSADLLLQGHIFHPGSVEEDIDEEGNNEAAVIKGSICSKALYKKLNRKGRGHGHHGGEHHDDD